MKLKLETGQLLLAEPFMDDENFKTSVVLLCNYANEGAFGFIINKKMNLHINELIDDFPSFNAKVYLGGPVENDLLHFLHCRPDIIDDSTEVAPGIFWGGNFEMVKMMVIAGQLNSNEIKFIAGYSGWESSQLQNELFNGSWIQASAKPEYIFNNDGEKIWRRILNDLGGHYKILSNIPENPNLN